jgi:hypothetical protein
MTKKDDENIVPESRLLTATESVLRRSCQPETSLDSLGKQMRLQAESQVCFEFAAVFAF